MMQDPSGRLEESIKTRSSLKEPLPNLNTRVRISRFLALHSGLAYGMWESFGKIFRPPLDDLSSANRIVSIAPANDNEQQCQLYHRGSPCFKVRVTAPETN